MDNQTQVEHIQAELFGIQVGTFRPATEEEVKVLSDRANEGDSSIVFLDVTLIGTEEMEDGEAHFQMTGMRTNFWRTEKGDFTPGRDKTLVITQGNAKNAVVKGSRRTRREPFFENLICEGADLPGALSAQKAAQGISDRRVLRGSLRLVPSKETGERILYIASLTCEAQNGSVGDALEKALAEVKGKKKS
jgi:hypothetical protein